MGHFFPLLTLRLICNSNPRVSTSWPHRPVSNLPATPLDFPLHLHIAYYCNSNPYSKKSSALGREKVFGQEHKDPFFDNLGTRETGQLSIIYVMKGLKFKWVLGGRRCAAWLAVNYSEKALCLFPHTRVLVVAKEILSGVRTRKTAAVFSFLQKAEWHTLTTMGFFGRMLYDPFFAWWVTQNCAFSWEQSFYQNINFYT